MKIKVKLFNPKCKLEVNPKGDWIDLRASESFKLDGPKADVLRRGNKKEDDINVNYREVHFTSQLIPLGIAMELPKGYEAVINPRSSTFNKFHITSYNNQGVIDNTYNGNDDQWKFAATAYKRTTINAGDRICQFRLQLSQFATPWQKIKWLFSNPKIKFIYVDSLSSRNRGGFGSTGIN